MSRSRRKTPIIGNTTSESEKLDKRYWHKRFRMALSQQRDADESPPVSHRQVSSPWKMAKDGKQYLKKFNRKWMMK